MWHRPPADIVTTRSALHQLPDFWKQAALLEIARYVRPGGLLYVWDLVFGFRAAEYAEQVQRMSTAGGAERSVRSEHRS